MEYRHQQLRQELSKLNKTFADLGATLTGAAKEITSAGIAPGDKLVEQITSTRKSFEAVRGSVHGLAVELLIKPLPKPDELSTIAGIDALLGQAANAEENRSLILDERAQALATLARVLSIVHREQGDFKPLVDCLAAAKGLSDAIANTPWPNRHTEAENLVADRHPLTALLSLVVNRDILDDDKWIQLDETVTVTYGKALSVAASRNKLTMSDGRKPATAPEAAAKPAKAAEAPKAGPAANASPAPAPAPAAAPAASAPAPVAAAVAPPTPVMTTPAVPLPPPAPTASAAAPVLAPAAAVSTPVAAASVAPVPPAPVPAPVLVPAAAPAPQAAPAAVAVAEAEAPKAEIPKPESVRAAVAEKKQLAVPASAPPVAAAAVQATPAVEAKPNSHIAPAVPVEDKRKEPRVVAPAQMPKPVESKVEEKQEERDDVKPVPAGAGAASGAAANSGDRPQRWGFWRGNR